MTIHHATKARAEKLGIAIIELRDGDLSMAQASWDDRSWKHADPKMAVSVAALDRALTREYPGIMIVGDEKVGYVVADAGEGSGFHDIDAPDDADLAKVLAAAEEAGIDPETAPEGSEEPEEEEEKVSHSIVPAKYRKEYAERGNPNHCGDWVAEFLDGAFTDEEGLFLPAKFLAFLGLNGVDLTGKWAHGSELDRSWKGRMRMNGRQKLDVAIAISGEIKNLDGSTTLVPPFVLGNLRTKHAKQVAVAAKRAAQAEASIKEAVEG